MEQVQVERVMAMAEVEETLHLKSFCSMAAPGVLLVGGPWGLALYNWLAINAQHHLPPEGHGAAVTSMPYQVAFVPDAAAANCLSVNGTVVRRACSEFPLSEYGWQQVTQLYNAMRETTTPGRHWGLKETGSLIQVQVESGELAKVDGALTCCSVLLHL